METEDNISRPSLLVAAWYSADLARMSLEVLMSKEDLTHLHWRSHPERKHLRPKGTKLIAEA